MGSFTITAVVLISVLGFPAPALQETREYTVAVVASDGTRVHGTCRLSPSLTVKTKYGELKVDFDTIHSLQQQEDHSWTAFTREGQVVGTLELKKIEIKTASGSLQFGLQDVRVLTLMPPSPAPDPKPEPPKKAPRPHGTEYRKSHDLSREPLRGVFPSLLLSDGKRVAILSAADDECVVVELASGAVTPVKVESGPCALCEKDGKLYVANGKSSSLSVIDAVSLKVKGRVPLGSPPCWVSAPVLGNIVYVLTQSDKERLLRLDSIADRILGPISQPGSSSFLFPQLEVAACPDHRFLIVESERGQCEVFWIDGGRLISTGLPRPLRRAGPPLFDFMGGRVYAGGDVYSLDLQRMVFSNPEQRLLVPHPTKNLVFGVGVPLEPFGYQSTGRVTVFDEETMTASGQIDIGDPVLSVIPTEDKLYVVGPTRIYTVELAGNVSQELLSKPRAQRVPAELSHPVSAADIKKSEFLVVEAQLNLEAGKLEEARKKFEAAEQVDPLGGGRLGAGMMLYRQNNYAEAIDVLRGIASYPFRDLKWTLQAIHYLGASLSGLRRDEESLQAYWLGLRLGPENALLQYGMGNTQMAAGLTAGAYLYWSRSLRSDPKQPELRKKVGDVLKSIMKETTGKCAVCEGSGRLETTTQEEGKPRQKQVKECKLCKGVGKTWKQPCLDCMGLGKTTTRAICDHCLGAGFTAEPEREKF